LDRFRLPADFRLGKIRLTQALKISMSQNAPLDVYIYRGVKISRTGSTTRHRLTADRRPATDP